jgi:non-specific serine/threonine protein kinase
MQPMAADESHDDKTQSFIALTSGTEVLHYKILEKIGSGGMGEVYLALDTKLNRKVALKFLPPHLCQDEDCRKRFTREAQAAAGLDHPNVAAIHEVGEHQGRPFYGMQIVEGQSLKEVIAGTDLPIDRILEIGIQVCDGLQAAHDNGVIHRDIKPSNILLDDHGRVRIVDFGLAAIRGSEQLTQTGSTLGTIGYMSPEQVQGKEIDRRSDLFSLGVVLYELITKRNPFKRDSEAATLKAVSDDMPEPLARFKSGLPEGLQDIVQKALEKDVKTRYQHADGFLSDLVRLKKEHETSHTIGSCISPVRPSHRAVWLTVSLLAVAAIVTLVFTKPWTTAPVSEEPSKIMLAVLPFENLGNAEDAYFADGMTEEITARLAHVKELGVIARTSTKQYKNTDKSVTKIGEELGIDYILKGTVRWQKSTTGLQHIRVTPQLIKVSDATQVWANVYDEALSEVFALQSNIAGRVVEALNITLVETEREALAAVPTTNLEAYDFYLQGKEYFDRYVSMDDLTLAVQMFEKAVEIDSTFAWAHAWLTRLYTMIPDFADQAIVDSLKEVALQHAAEAEKFSGDGVEGRLAMGWYHFSNKDFDEALREFEAALVLQPNNSDVLNASATVLRRQGHWQEALELYERNVRLDPRSVGATWDLAVTYTIVRRFDDFKRVTQRGLTLMPDYWPFKTLTAWALISESGDFDSALILIDDVLSQADMEFINSFKMEIYFLQRKFEECLKIPTTADNVWHGDGSEFYLMRGHAFDELGRHQLALTYYDSAQTILETRIESGTDYARNFTRLGRVYALQGDTSKALEFGRRGYEMCPMSEDAFQGTLIYEDLAKVYSLAGEPELAIKILDSLLSIPSHLNLIHVKQHPAFDPLRNHPRYQALIAKYEKKHGT